MNIEMEEIEVKKWKKRIEEEILELEKKLQLFKEHIEQLQEGKKYKAEQDFPVLVEQLMEYERELKVCVRKMEMGRKGYQDAEEEIVKIMCNMKRIL